MHTTFLVSTASVTSTELDLQICSAKTQGNPCCVTAAHDTFVTLFYSLSEINSMSTTHDFGQAEQSKCQLLMLVPRIASKEFVALANSKRASVVDHGMCMQSAHPATTFHLSRQNLSRHAQRCGPPPHRGWDRKHIGRWGDE